MSKSSTVRLTTDTKTALKVKYGNLSFEEIARRHLLDTESQVFTKLNPLGKQIFTDLKAKGFDDTTVTALSDIGDSLVNDQGEATLETVVEAIVGIIKYLGSPVPVADVPGTPTPQPQSKTIIHKTNITTKD